MAAKSSCDPYSSFGTLQVDPNDADRNRWIPFDPTCQPPNYLAKLRDYTLHPDSNVKASEFSWLYNKTALLIGDSISREHVENFCQLMGEESEVIRPNHRWAAGPAPMRAPIKAQHSIERPHRLNGKRGYRVVRDASRPRVCYIPKFDFLVSSLPAITFTRNDKADSTRLRFCSSFRFSISDSTKKITGETLACLNTLLPECLNTDSSTKLPPSSTTSEQTVVVQLLTMSKLLRELGI